MTPTPTLFPSPTVDASGPRLELVAGVWVFRLRRELRSLNVTMWRHWRAAQREREAWELALAAAIASFVCVRTVEGWSAEDLAALRTLKDQRERRRVQIVRCLPHARHRLDPGNLRACDKHLVDALKRVGLIHNDNATWLDHQAPTEIVAPDGRWSTVVQLERPDVRGAWRS